MRIDSDCKVIKTRHMEEINMWRKILNQQKL